MNQFGVQLLETIKRHPEKIQVRLAWTIPYEFEVWDIVELMREYWRWD